MVGVVDGFAPRPEAPRLPGPTVPLRADESVRVRTAEGQDLLEVRPTDQGPVVRLLHDDLDLELPGRLRLRAETIRLQATRGNVELSATDDVELVGEMIHLNP